VTTPAPVNARNSILTQGKVQLNLHVGQTTKAQVLEAFGSPNVELPARGDRKSIVLQKSVLDGDFDRPSFRCCWLLAII
jgi:hypothetical protein